MPIVANSSSSEPDVWTAGFTSEVCLFVVGAFNYKLFLRDNGDRSVSPASVDGPDNWYLGEPGVLYPWQATMGVYFHRAAADGVPIRVTTGVTAATIKNWVVAIPAVAPNLYNDNPNTNGAAYSEL